MAKYKARNARGANRPNPREDRNWDPTESGYSNRKNYRKETAPAVAKPSAVEVKPRTLAQKAFLCSIKDPNTSIVFGVGPAGTGKTYLATLQAIKMLKSGIIDKIVICRPNVAVDDTGIGFLPGDVIAKQVPWLLPVLDVFGKYYSQLQIKNMLEEGIIEAVPLAFIRGRTFDRSYILFDESQNSTPTSLLSVLTRIGEDSKLIVTGDLKQSDRYEDNGLKDFLARFDPLRTPGVDVVRFDHTDIQRHPVIGGILKMYGED